MTVDKKAELYLVIRVPTTGPRALIAAPNEFSTEAEARQRIASIESKHKMQHHTHLEVFSCSGDKFEALKRAGIIY